MQFPKNIFFVASCQRKGHLRVSFLRWLGHSSLRSLLCAVEILRGAAPLSFSSVAKNLGAACSRMTTTAQNQVRIRRLRRQGLAPTTARFSQRFFRVVEAPTPTVRRRACESRSEAELPQCPKRTVEDACPYNSGGASPSPTVEV